MACVSIHGHVCIHICISSDSLTSFTFHIPGVSIVLAGVIHMSMYICLIFWCCLSCLEFHMAYFNS